MARIKFASGAGGTFGSDDLPCAAAESLGFWAREGVEVAWTPVRGGVAAVAALERGEVDVAYAAYSAALAAQARGLRVRILCSMSLGLAQALVAQRSIATPEQLRGTRWAVDGLGAMSHTFARQVLHALSIDEGEIEWITAGPPPERIAALAEGRADVSLIRYEESIWAPRRHPRLHCLLSFSELQRLAPVQIHGVLATLQGFDADLQVSISRGMILASRRLHESRPTFVEAMRQALEGRGDLSTTDLEQMWSAMHEAGAFAVNGGMSTQHWQPRAVDFRRLNPELAGSLDLGEALAPDAVRSALAELRAEGATFDPTV